MTKNSTAKPITSNPVQDLDIHQLAEFSVASIHAEKVMEFNPATAFARFQAHEGDRVLGADFGGDKGLLQLFEVREGRLTSIDDYKDYVQGDDGEGYLECLERAADFANKNGNIPIGISWGAPLDGTKPLYHPKMKKFLGELKDKYDGDFKNVLPTLAACMNDGPAGLISGAIESYRLYQTDTILLPISGGGLGMSVLLNNTLYSTEAGHVKALDTLNTYSQDTACGVFGSTYTCIEIVGANKAGIEKQWQQKNGSYLRAKEIENRFKEGNEFAGEIYDHSAWVVAHMIQGTADALGIDISLESSAIVGHGGGFKFPGYGERIVQILEKHNSKPTRLLLTKDFGAAGSNACLDGAAIAALVIP